MVPTLILHLTLHNAPRMSMHHQSGSGGGRLRASAVISISDISAREHLDLGTQSAKGTYLEEILGKGKQKYFWLKYFVFGFRPKA